MSKKEKYSAGPGGAVYLLAPMVLFGGIWVSLKPRSPLFWGGLVAFVVIAITAITLWALLARRRGKRRV